MKTCILCEEPIAEARLMVLPNTRICLLCQSKREKNGEFRRSHMEISQSTNGWQFEDLETKIVKGED